MTLQITADGLRNIFPRAPRACIEDVLPRWQAALDRVGITASRTRLAFFFANIEHECGGFTIKNLTENINYTAERAAQIWPSRFPDAAAVRAKFGTAPGWQLAMFDSVYGSRMGNRPGTHDGSRYIGRGGPQWTGRDGYEALQRLTGLPAVERPEVAADLSMQPEVCAAFWQWKGLNARADADDFKGCVKLWNGGLIGLDDRQHLLKGNQDYINRLIKVEDIQNKGREVFPGTPSEEAKKRAIERATVTEKAGATVGGTVAAGGAGAVVLSGDKPQPSTKPNPAPAQLPQTKPTVEAPKPLPKTMDGPPIAAIIAIIGVVVLTVSIILIARKGSAVARSFAR